MLNSVHTLEINDLYFGNIAKIKAIFIRGYKLKIYTTMYSAKIHIHIILQCIQIL